MKKIYITFCILSAHYLLPITSTINHNVISSSTLLYKMIDYAQPQFSFEIAPLYNGIWNNNISSNIILNGKQTLTFSQQGLGDFNPTWINLIANTPQGNYESLVTFNPTFSQAGTLLHTYNQFEHWFFDIRTALVQTKSQVGIKELGGSNGLYTNITNAQQAFTQTDWNYGKIGQENHVTGLDDIEIRIGGIQSAKKINNGTALHIAGFALIQAPTGTGTTAQWLFEPQVGTNHWGLGLGFENLVSSHDISIMIAGNYRYLMPAWEVRSFDLQNNGSWSRYLGLQALDGLPTAPTSLPLPGINYFTQPAYIQGRSQVNMYTRLAKKFNHSLFEIGYNFTCTEHETIKTIENMPTGYGIYALTGQGGSAGGMATANKATINQATTELDPINQPVEISSKDFNKFSACAGTYASNTLTARVEVLHNNIVLGFGGALQAGLSQQALSTWTVWAKFEYLFDNIKPNSCTQSSSSSFLIERPRTTDNTNKQNVCTNIQYEDKENLLSPCIVHQAESVPPTKTAHQSTPTVILKKEPIENFILDQLEDTINLDETFDDEELNAHTFLFNKTAHDTLE